MSCDYLKTFEIISTSLFLIGALFIIVKPLNIWFYEKIGFILEDSKHSSYLLPTFGFEAYYSKESSILRAAFLLIYWTMQTIFLFIITITIGLIWPLLIVFVLVWGFIYITDKFKKD